MTAQLAIGSGTTLTLAQEACDQMKWEPVPTKPGDVVFFDSFVPHRSGPNASDLKRRISKQSFFCSRGSRAVHRVT